MAKIQLNGKKITIRPKITIYELLKRFKLNNKKVAIEYNGIIIPKLNYKKKYLKNKDRSISFFLANSLQLFSISFNVILPYFSFSRSPKRLRFGPLRIIILIIINYIS